MAVRSRAHELKIVIKSRGLPENMIQEIEDQLCQKMSCMEVILGKDFVYVSVEPVISLVSAQEAAQKIFPPNYPPTVYKSWSVDFEFGESLSGDKTTFVCAAIREEIASICAISRDYDGIGEMTAAGIRVEFNEYPSSTIIDTVKAIITRFI